MKKKILLVIIVFLITGCSGKYELEIKNEKVIEKTTALYNSKEVLKDPYEHTLDISLKYDDNGDFLIHETKKNVKDGDKVGVELTNNYHSIDDFKNYSQIINRCYNANNITNTNNTITIKTSNEFTCLEKIEELDEVTIVIKSNHKLKSTNADKKKGATYYWYINKDNYKEKPISLVLHSNKKVWYYDVLKKLILIILVIGGTVLVAFTGYKLYRKREDNVNF